MLQSSASPSHRQHLSALTPSSSLLSPPKCATYLTTHRKASDCVLALTKKEQSCQTVLAIKQCYDDYCPELDLPKEINTIIDTCENGGTFPGSGSGSGTSSGTGSETGTRTGSDIESTSTSGSESGSGSSSGSGSTRTSSADDSVSSDFNSGIPGGGSTPTSSGADSTNTGLGAGLDSGDSAVPSSTSEPTNTSTNSDGPVATDRSDNQGAGDKLFAPVGAIVGSLVAVMAWL